ncbi:hypothetical protein [Glycomyces sp. NPDC021274]|uniref:hypothetical protein n=1 Tax=Glycomyces sp. NPDC021274 TaxID=3155120 RepID=UPI0033E438AC
MNPIEWWRDRLAAERDETEQLLRETYLFDTAEDDPVVERFRDAQRALVDLIPATPLCPPALIRWKGIEASLAHDPEFMLPVLDALRQRPTT